jgi:hypothetical protein
MKKRILSIAMSLALIVVMAMPMVISAGTTVVTADVGNPPTITDISPNHGAPGEMPSVTITGTNFVDGQTTVTVANYVTVGTLTVTTTTITANFTVASEALAGSQTVTVNAAGQEATTSFLIDTVTTLGTVAAFNIGALNLNGTKTDSKALTNLVTTNGTTWSVLVDDARTTGNDGFMETGTNDPLAYAFMINKVNTSYVSAASGFSYVNTDTKSPTLYYSQQTGANETVGTYTITLTFTLSTP